MNIVGKGMILAILSVGCVGLTGCSSSSSAPAGNGGGGGGGGGTGADGGTTQSDSGSSGANALVCPQITWCTSSTPTDKAPVNMPALTGGTIADGFYRSEEEGNPFGFLFQGSQVLEVFPGVDNELGTYAIDGANLNITTTVLCAAGQADKTPDDANQTYTFAVQGNDLFLKSPEEYGSGDPGRRFQRIASPNDVCTDDSDFMCRASEVCTCSFSTGTTLQSCN